MIAFASLKTCSYRALMMVMEAERADCFMADIIFTSAFATIEAREVFFSSPLLAPEIFMLDNHSHARAHASMYIALHHMRHRRNIQLR